MFLTRTPFYSKHVIFVLTKGNKTVLSGRIE